MSWEKLSETLEGPRDPEHCQGCGAQWVDLTRWWECDENDEPTSTLIVVCLKCVRRLITPHERLYVQLEENQHYPGSMSLCELCHHRDGVSCSQSKHAGGPGVEIKPVPSRVHLKMSGRSRSGIYHFWKPATECSHRVIFSIVG